MTEPRGGKILVLQADTAEAEASAEMRLIDEELSRDWGPEHRDRYSVEPAPAVRAADLSRHLLSHRVDSSSIILHVCCVVEDGGLRFHPDEAAVSGPALAELIRATAEKLPLLALSRCFSQPLAEDLEEVFEYQLGTVPEIDTEAARCFLRGFYRGIAAGKAPRTAFGIGRAEVGTASLDASGCRDHPAEAPAGPKQPKQVIPSIPEPSVAPPLPTEPGSLDPTPPPAEEAEEAATPPADQVTNLPSRNASFVGRSSLLLRIGEALSGEAAFVTQVVRGMGGVGKSELALEYAHRERERYDLTWWIAAEEPEAVPLQLDQLASALGLPGVDGAERLDAVRRWLESTPRWLLILDNVEEWTAVRRHLPRAGEGHVLVTTRQPDIDPAAIPVDLFTSREAEHFIRVKLGDRQLDASPLLDAVGRLPLALEQACSYILETGCSVEEYAVLFEERTAELLAVGDTGDHDGTVAATFALALEQAEVLCARNDLCSDPVGLATVLAFLGADQVPVSLLRHLHDEDVPGVTAGLRSVGEDALVRDASLGVLRRVGLIERDGPLVSMHRLVQAVVRGGLDDEASAGWVRSVLHLLLRALPDPVDHRRWREFERLLPHVEAALQHQGAAPEPSERLLRQVGSFFDEMAQVEAAEGSLQRALQIGEELHGPNGAEVAATLDLLGIVQRKQGDLESARESQERALAIKEGLYGVDHPEVAKTLGNLGNVQLKQSDLESARESQERALEIEEQVYGADHPEVAKTLGNLGIVYRAQGDLESARESQERALAIKEGVYSADHPEVANTLVNLGTVYRAQGDLESAGDCWRQALATFESLLGPDHPHTQQTREALASLEQE